MSDPITAARELQPLVREAADEAERVRHLPARVAEAMAKAGLYRVAAPSRLGGGDHDPVTQIRTIEAISEADGSTGWNLMIGIENFGLLAASGKAHAALFADPRTIVAGSTAAFGRAVPVDGGYEVSGEWQFVSGVHNCHFFAGLSFVHENGAPKPGALPEMMVMPRSDIEILDTWNVSGLRGSGSHDVRVEGAFVPAERTGQFMGARTPGNGAEPILRFPRGARLSYNKVGVALGIARAAIDDFVDLATGKVPRFSGSSLRERPFAQRAVAAAEARLRGGRAFAFEAVGEVWERVVADETPSDRQRALLQVACSDAVRASAEAVDLVAEAAGTTANFVDSPLERRARDVRVIRQHFTVAPHHLEDAGRVLLGLPPEGAMLNMV